MPTQTRRTRLSYEGPNEARRTPLTREELLTERGRLMPELVTEDMIAPLLQQGDSNMEAVDAVRMPEAPAPKMRMPALDVVASPRPDPEAVRPPEALPEAPPPPAGTLPEIPVPAAPDYRAHMAEAEETERKARLMGGMGQVGAQFVKDVTGAGSSKVFDNIIADSGAGYEALDRQKTLDALAQKAMADKEARDPNSATNRKARQAFISAAPKLAAELGEAVNRMTTADFEKFLPMEDARRKQSEIENQNFINNEQQNQQQEETARHNKAMEKIGWANANRLKISAENAGAKDEAIRLRQISNQLIKLGSETSKKFSDYTASLEKLETLAPGFTDGDFANVTPLSDKERVALEMDPTGIAARVIAKNNPKGLAFHTMIKTLVDDISRDKSGAVLNESEVDYYNKLLQQSLGAGAKAQAEAVAQLKAHVFRKLADMQRGYGQVQPGESASVLDQYETLGGTTFRKPIFKKNFAPEAVPPSPAAPQIQAKSVVDRIKMPDGTTVVLYSDGSEEIQ